MSAAAGAIRTLVPSDFLEHLRQTYPVGGIELTMDLGGSRNLNLLLTTRIGMLVVRTYRGGMTADRLASIQAVRRVLGEHGVPTSQVVRTRTGDAFTRYEGQLVELEEFVDHSGRLDSWAHLEAGAPVLGRTHAILRTITGSPASRRPPDSNYLGTADVQVWLPRALQRIESWPAGPESLAFAREADALARELYDAEASVRGRLPTQLVHGCFWGANVLLRAGKVVLVSDWDFLGEQPRIEDLALTLYCANATLSRDPTSAVALRRLRALVEAYNGELDVPLTTEERTALPLAIARAPLAALRHVAQTETPGEATRLIAGMTRDVRWARSVVDHRERWQRAFA